MNDKITLTDLKSVVVPREAEFDGTQAIADAIAPDEGTAFFFDGMKIVLDPNCPPGIIYRLPDRHECVVKNEQEFLLNCRNVVYRTVRPA